MVLNLDTYANVNLERSSRANDVPKTSTWLYILLNNFDVQIILFKLKKIKIVEKKI